MNAKFVHQSFRYFLALWLVVLLTASTLSVPSPTPRPTPASYELAGTEDCLCG